MDKTQIQNIARSVFERYKGVDKVYITSDGQSFTDEACAVTHRQKNRTGKELGMETFLRGDIKSRETAPGKTAEQLIAEIAAMTEVEAVQTLVDGEAAGKNRKTVIDAGEKKLAELKAQL